MNSSSLTNKRTDEYGGNIEAEVKEITQSGVKLVKGGKEQNRRRQATPQGSGCHSRSLRRRPRDMKSLIRAPTVAKPHKVIGILVGTIAIVAVLLNGCLGGLMPLPQEDLLASDSSLANIEPSVKTILTGLTGAVEDILVAQLAEDGDKVVLLGTSEGLYIVSQGTSPNFIPTPGSVSHIGLLPDVTGDGRRDIVITIQDRHFPSIRSYDPATGDEIWRFALKQEVFVENIGWSEIQILPTNLEVIRDAYIAVVLGRYLVLLEGKTGRQLWKLKAEDNLEQITEIPDIDRDGRNDLVVAPELRFLYVISGRTGKLLKEIEAVTGEVIDGLGNRNFYVPTISDIVSLNIQGREKVAVSSSGDGKLRLVDLLKGTVDWEVSIAPSSSGWNPWFALGKVEDVTQDGNEEILASTSSELSLINADSGEKIWELSGLSQGQIFYTGEERAIWLHSIQDLISRLTMDVIDIKDGKIIQTLEIVGPESASPVSGQVKGYDENSFLLICSQGLLQVSFEGEVLWDYLRASNVTVERRDFTGDEIPDFLLYSKGYRADEVKTGTRMLSVLNGATLEKVWTYVMDYDQFLSSGGIKDIVIVPDFDQDEREDIAGYVQSGEHTELVFFSSRDGSSLRRTLLGKQLSSLDYFPRSGGEAFAVATPTNISIITLEGETLWTKTYADWGSGVSTDSQAEVKVLDALNGDNISDLVVFLSGKVIIGKSNGSNGSVEFVSQLAIEAEEGETFGPGAIVADVDGDGVKDIMLRQTRGWQTSQIVLSSRTGETLLELEGNTSSALAVADFNADGYRDHIVFWQGEYSVMSTSHAIESPELKVISGKDGEVLWEFTDFSTGSVYMGGEPGISYLMPAAAISDINGDGIADLALTKAALYGGTWVDIYDIAHNKLLKEIVVKEPEGEPQTYQGDGGESWHAGNLIEEVSDLNGDENKEVALIAALGKGGELQTVVVDVVNDRVVASFQLEGSQFIKLEGSRLGLVGWSGEVYLLDVAHNFRLTAPTEGTHDSPLKIKWEGASPGAFNQVFIDGLLTAQTDDSSVTLAVARGEHRLRVHSVDEYGRVLYATGGFRVEKGLSAVVFASILLATLILVAILPGLRNRVRKSRRRGRGYGQ